MSSTHTFHAMIEPADPGSGGAYITVPFDAEEVFGKKRIKVRATFDGVPYRGTLGRMGTSGYVLLVLKGIRKQIGKDIGDEIEVTVQEDSEPRLVSVPDDLKTALATDPQAQAFFEKLSYTHQKEYVRWVEEAKRPETRQKRIQGTIEMLQQGKKERNN